MSETIHGTAVLIGAHGVLIRGESGAGKSALALALVKEGARLIADDRLMISSCHGRIVASAPRAISGMIELRGRGILKLPYEQSGILRLVVDIVADDDLERMPEASQFNVTLLEVALPRQPVPAAVERAVPLIEAALSALSREPEKGLADRASLGIMAALPPPMAPS